MQLLRSAFPTTLFTALTALATFSEAAAEGEVVVPPPVSGRSLNDPSSILPADVLARVNLLRAHLEEVRLYMGRPKPLSPLIRLEEAEPREVYAQAAILVHGVQILAFEQLRIPQERTDVDHDVVAADSLRLINRTLRLVLELKRSLGIGRPIAEKLAEESTTPAETFNAVVEVGMLAHVLLDQRTDASTVFTVTMAALQLARQLHVGRTRALLPPPNAFEPNKTSDEVLAVLLECLKHTQAISQTHDIAMLRLVSVPRDEPATPDDVLQLAGLLISELVFLHDKLLERPAMPQFIVFGLKFPSHNLQKARDLASVLESWAKTEKVRR